MWKHYVLVFRQNNSSASSGTNLTITANKQPTTSSEKLTNIYYRNLY